MLSYGQNITSVAHLHQLHVCCFYENDRQNTCYKYPYERYFSMGLICNSSPPVGLFFSLRCQENFERTVCFEHNVNTHLPPEWAFCDSAQVKVIQLSQDQDDLQQQETCVWLHAAQKPLQRRGMHYPSTPNDMGYIQLVCLIAFINMKHPPPIARCPNDKWSSGCQDVSVCWWPHLKNISVAVRSCVCTSCGMIPTWQQKNPNIIVHWTIKWNAVGACTSSLIRSFFVFFQTCAFLFSPNVWCGGGKHWSLMLMKDAKPNIFRAGSGPDPFWSKCFCIFSEDGWTMPFWANRNAAHKSLPGHRG